MIEAERLTKRYAGFTAVQDLSFAVGRGEIAGFLGPNGAGKSSTMRMLACFLPPTSGRARVAGFDVFSQSLEVRRRVGYLPESTPLYLDMRVGEYLAYRAAIRGLGRSAARQRIGAVLEQCQLADVERRIVGQLSKGYRQRVGIADALLHEPELLILDEPTIGLDPTQIRQMRELIRGLAGKHTVLLSTHILPEVEATCTRVLILHRGRIAAQGTPAEVVAQSRVANELTVELEAGDEATGALERVEGVLSVRKVPGVEPPWRRFALHLQPGADPRAAVHALAVEKRWGLRELSRRTPSLEDVFVRLVHSEEPTS